MIYLYGHLSINLPVYHDFFVIHQKNIVKGFVQFLEKYIKILVIGGGKNVKKQNQSIY